MEAEKSLKCPNCFSSVSDDLDFCPYCKVEFYNCSDCNALVLGNDTCCRNCGSKLEDEKVTKPPDVISSSRQVYEYKSLEVITNILLILLVSAILFSLINIYGIANDISFLKENMNSGGTLYNDELSFQNVLISISRLLSIIVFLTGSIIYFVWVRRAYRNLHTLQSKPTEHSSAWAIGSYFVPFINLVWPYQIMNEIWIRNQTEIIMVEESNSEFYERRTSTSFLNIWWAVFLINGFVNNLSSFLTSRANTAQMLITSYWIDIISYVTGIFLCLLILYLVWTINNWQSEKMKNKPTKSCQNCGNQVEFDALFCTHCGKYLKTN